MHRPTMRDEYVEVQFEMWLEVYKKSALTIVILQQLSTGFAWTSKLRHVINKVSEWDITERGLYRALRRLNDLGFVTYKEVSVPKTGIRRKEYSITDLGRSLLEAAQVELKKCVPR